MNITKYIHSCLVVENDEKIILLDPGNYSYNAHVLDIAKLQHLDAIGITHEHIDHMYIPWIQEIQKQFPKTPIFTTPNAKKILEQEGIHNILIRGNEFLTIQAIPHEKIWFGNPVENIMITLFNDFATVGDSLTFNSSPRVLALPVQAPWGSTTWAVETAIKIKPKVIIPIHDWHWKDEARESMYQRLREYFATYDIDFRTIETGRTERV